MAARGQGIPLDSRKLAPGLQFVIFRLDFWSNHLLFIKRAFYYMLKLFFEINCIHNRLQILGDPKNVSGESTLSN